MASTISTTDVDDIISPYLFGKMAFAELTPNPSKSLREIEAGYNVIDKNIDMFLDMGAAGTLALAAWEEVEDLYKDLLEEAEYRVKALRKWAQRSLAAMKEDSPVMTGNLRDSIRIIGSGPLDINVKIDEEIISERKTMKNIVPYTKHYQRWLKHGAPADELKAPGEIEVTRESDYSDVVDSQARPKKWWELGTESLVGFKSVIWENTKSEIADELGVDYTPEFEDTSASIKEWLK